MMLRKLVTIGDSKAVIIPAEYLSYYEKIKGKKIKQVGIKIDEKIIIDPIFKDDSKE